MNRELKGAVILITGGTGSFGNKLARALHQLSAGEIRIFSRDEKKQWEMAQRYPHFRYILGDVRDPVRVDEAMRGVDYVFHAAALKHVSACEENPTEAIKTNVLGSENACAAAQRNGVRAFVALSTDKAVKPVNAMGMSKALMEKIVCAQNLRPTPTVFSCVRYGNVMGSRGSVIPLFRNQISEGNPITVTVPEMTRFMMSIDDSVDLVFRAMTQARGGEIFVRKSPACTVQLLAETLRLKYSPLGDRHPISVLGARAAEKLEETLVNEYEMQRVQEERDYFTIFPEYRLPEKLTPVDFGIEYTSANTEQLSRPQDVSHYLDRMGAVEQFI